MTILGHDWNTAFPTVENPVSESGRWMATGVDWSNCSVDANGIRGQQIPDGGGSAGSPYNDSTALLAGTWGNDQTVQVVLRKAATWNSGSVEAEIRLRSSMSAHSSTGYEVYWSLVTGNSYLNIAQWLGPVGSYANIAQATVGVSVANGDVLKASITGTVIRAYINNVLKLTYDTASDAVKFSSGLPGVGFFIQNVPQGDQANFSFTSAIATDNGVIAPTLSQTDVQSAITAATAGQTVHLRAGTVTWTTQVSWNAPANVTLQGAGTTALGGGDKTTITDNYTTNAPLLNIVTNALGQFRIFGITFKTQTTGVKDGGLVNIGGSSKQFVMGYCHFDSRSGNISKTILLHDWIYGVVYKSQFHLPGSLGGQIHIYHGTWGNAQNGDGSWADDTFLGTDKFVFFEDCDWVSPDHAGVVNDSTEGGRWVFRYNTMKWGAVQTHPTGGGGRHRGSRAYEVYGNTFTGDAADPADLAAFISAGTGVFWGNNFPVANGYKSFATIHSMRRDNSTYPEVATPNGWGYSGTSFNGTGSNWDQNANPVTGYRCLDQPGNGKGDLLSGDVPNIINTRTGTIAWPNQALEPIYEWSNAGTFSAGFWTNYNTDVLSANVEYYLYTPTFNGATGVGVGTLANRPASGLTAGVGYWATDTQTLYTAASSTSWVIRYQPYTYPHPLRTDSVTTMPTSNTFPFVGTTATTAAASGTTTFTGNIPLGTAVGDLLITVITASASSTTIADATNNWITPTNCYVSSTGLASTSTLMYKIAAGGDALSMSKSSGIYMSGTMVRIPVSCWHGTTPPEVTTVSVGSGADPNPGSLTPSWGADNTLWGVGFSHKTVGAQTGFAFPANYTQAATYVGASGNGSYGRAQLAWRQNLNAATEDPGAFTFGNIGGVVYTIGVRPKTSQNPFDTEKVFVLVNATPSGATAHKTLQDGGTFPPFAVTTTGWTTGTKAAGQSALQQANTEVSASTAPDWSTTLQPTATGPSATRGDCWRSDSAINGTFANSAWYFRLGLLSVTAAYTGICRLGVRLWRSVDANGVGATEITSTRFTSAVTSGNLDTSALSDLRVGTFAWNPAATVTLTNEYLWMQVGLEVTTAGGGSTQDALMRCGPYNVLTSIFTAAPAVVDYFLGSDIAVGGWTPSTGTTLFGVLDEVTPSDTDYISSQLNPDFDQAELKFIGVQTPTAGPIIVSYRIRGDGATSLDVQLRDPAFGEIQTWTHSPLPSVFTQFDQTVDPANVANIVNYDNLRLDLNAY